MKVLLPSSEALGQQYFSYYLGITTELQSFSPTD